MSEELGRSPLWSSVPIIGRLVARFNLDDHATESDAMLLPRTIQPTTNVDELLAENSIETSGTVDPGATGQFSIYTVPLGRKAVLHVARVAKIGGGGTIVFTQLSIYDGVTNMVLLGQAAAIDIQYTLPHAVPMEEGWSVQVNVSAYTAGDDLNGQVLVTEQDAF